MFQPPLQAAAENAELQLLQWDGIQAKLKANPCRLLTNTAIAITSKSRLIRSGAR
jgi:hypothetical protein